MNSDHGAPRRKTPLEPEGVEVESCTLDLRFRLLHQTPFFAALTHSDIAEINRSFHERGFSAGEAIYHAGDPAARLYIVAAGKIKLLRHTLAGTDVLLDILGQGEFFGTLSTLGEPEYSDTALAQTDGCALWVDAESFQGILRRYPPVALSVLDIMATRLRTAHDAIRQLSAAPAESRIASTLLKLADKLGRPGERGVLINTPLSREDLAGMSGTTLETASRIISQFRKDGLIDSGRQWIAVVDRQGLEHLAQG